MHDFYTSRYTHVQNRKRIKHVSLEAYHGRHLFATRLRNITPFGLQTIDGRGGERGREEEWPGMEGGEQKGTRETQRKAGEVD